MAGSIFVGAGERGAYLAAYPDLNRQARDAPGCLDFVQAADPDDPERINIFERWESDEDVEAFRSSGTDSPAGPDIDIQRADVRKYRIASVEDP